MRTKLQPCEACSRHVKANESACPFCGAAITAGRAPLTAPFSRMTAAALVAAAVAASECGGTDTTASGVFYGSPEPTSTGTSIETSTGTSTATSTKTSTDTSIATSIDTSTDTSTETTPPGYKTLTTTGVKTGTMTGVGVFYGAPEPTTPITETATAVAAYGGPGPIVDASVPDKDASDEKDAAKDAHEDAPSAVALYGGAIGRDGGLL